MSELLDNSRHRIEALKGIIRQLHDGADPESLKAEFGDLLAEVGVGEIAAMENSLMADGMEQAEIQRMCDVHAAVLGGAGSCAPQEVPAGHPVHTFQLENAAIREIAADYRTAVANLGGRGALDACRLAQQEIAGVDVHYLRKEYLVFPYLEKAGIAGPPKVMWGVHDEIREKIAAAADLLENAGELDAEQLGIAVEAVIEPMLEQIESMTGKEDRILWPMCLEHLTLRDWEAVRGQWDEFGKGLVEPAGVWLPVLPQLPKKPVELPSDDAIVLPSGHLSLRQLTAVLNTLPMDITFVDADDRVGFFTEGNDRIFARNRAIIGRRVEDCHPPKSVHIVEQVVEELKSGKRDVAEFWIQMGPRFVHIRYFAVRDEGSDYLGTLEVTQDIAPMRALQGERRLLAEAPAEGAHA
ncbi:MAG: DUF438 domain-containing protein [Candidatus Sulfomarinibacteraceae bacterium]